MNIATKLFEDRAGIDHPLAIVASARSLYVSQQEFDMILRHRKLIADERRKGDDLL